MVNKKGGILIAEAVMLVAKEISVLSRELELLRLSLEVKDKEKINELLSPTERKWLNNEKN